MALIDCEVSINVVLLAHEERRENLVHVNSRDVIVVLLVDKVDKVHRLRIEPKQSYPFLEIHMFFLNLFDDGRKQIFHLLL
jgi:hypothetical protein